MKRSQTNKHEDHKSQTIVTNCHCFHIIMCCLAEEELYTNKHEDDDHKSQTIVTNCLYFHIIIPCCLDLPTKCGRFSKVLVTILFNEEELHCIYTNKHEDDVHKSQTIVTNNCQYNSIQYNFMLFRSAKQCVNVFRKCQ